MRRLQGNMLFVCRLCCCSVHQDQESGSWGQHDRRLDGSQHSARRAGHDVHHTEGLCCRPPSARLQAWLYRNQLISSRLRTNTFKNQLTVSLAGLLHPDPAGVGYIGSPRTSEPPEETQSEQQCGTGGCWEAAADASRTKPHSIWQGWCLTSSSCQKNEALPGSLKGSSTSPSAGKVMKLHY